MEDILEKLWAQPKLIGGGSENHEKYRDHPCFDEKRTEAELEEN